MIVLDGTRGKRGCQGSIWGGGGISRQGKYRMRKGQAWEGVGSVPAAHTVS